MDGNPEEKRRRSVLDETKNVGKTLNESYSYSDNKIFLWHRTNFENKVASESGLGRRCIEDLTIYQSRQWMGILKKSGDAQL